MYQEKWGRVFSQVSPEIKISAYSTKTNNMAGGLMQLVAYGAQDVYLTGNPKVTFSRLSTNATLLCDGNIEQTVNGTAATPVASPSRSPEMVI